MGQSCRQEVAGRFVVALAGDYVERTHPPVGVNQFVDDNVSVADGVANVGHAGSGLDFGCARAAAATWPQCADDAGEEDVGGGPLGGAGIGLGPQLGLPGEVLVAGGACSVVVVDDLDFGEASIVGDSALVFDQPAAEDRFAHGAVR